MAWTDRFTRSQPATHASHSSRKAGRERLPAAIIWSRMLFSGIWINLQSIMDRLWTPWRMPYLRGEDERPEGCIFCRKIDAADSKEHILYRGKHCYVALNRYPYSNGHLMVIPFLHVPSLENLDRPTLCEMMQVVKMSLAVLREAYDPQGFNVGVNLGKAAGAGIAEHVHMHIVPRWMADTNFMQVVGKTRLIPELLDDAYQRLKPLFARRAAS
jgi:ATP adenylyltransferase